MVEPKLRYEDSAGYSAVAGIYYYRARQDEFLNFIFDHDFDDKTDTIAAYGEGIVPLNDQLDLMVGARYEREDRRRVGGDAMGAIINFSLDETYEAFLPKAGLNWHPTQTMSWGFQVTRGYNAGGAGVTSPFPAPVPFIPYTFDSEYVWNYELYGRQRFADGRVRTTQNIFFSDYKDMQLPVDATPDDTGDGAFIVRNFDKVRTYGAELGVTALVTDALTLHGGLGLLWTEIVESPDTGLEGNELHTAPNVTANVGMVWTEGNWRASVSARYSSSYFTTIENRSDGKVGQFVVADAEVAYEFGSVKLFGSVKNIFDSEEPIALYQPSAFTAPLDRAVLQQPRTFLVGLRLRY